MPTDATLTRLAYGDCAARSSTRPVPGHHPDGFIDLIAGGAV